MLILGPIQNQYIFTCIDTEAHLQNVFHTHPNKQPHQTPSTRVQLTKILIFCWSNVDFTMLPFNCQKTFSGDLYLDYNFFLLYRIIFPKSFGSKFYLPCQFSHSATFTVPKVLPFLSFYVFVFQSVFRLYLSANLSICLSTQLYVSVSLSVCSALATKSPP